MVDFDGKNRFPGDEPWLTDGYGDYIRHYLRAMDTDPNLAPPGEDHILSSSSVIQEADYAGHLLKFYSLGFEHVDSNSVKIFYRTYDSSGTERIKLTRKPAAVLLELHALSETKTGEGFEWIPMRSGGLLIVRRIHGRKVIIGK